MDSRPSLSLFVYGSLKRGGTNHHWLQRAPWQGRARLAGHRLHSLGDYPMAVPGRGVVHGEVYGVDDADLARLDQLEDVPNEYRRLVCRLEDGRPCWVYAGSTDQVRWAPRVAYNDWQATPVFCYGGDLDPRRLRRRCPDWDGSAWLARLPGWRWQKASDSMLQRGVAARIEPDPQASCWGVVVHEPQSAAGLHGPRRAGAGEGWRRVGVRLEPWHMGRFGAPVGAMARVWGPEPAESACQRQAGPGTGDPRSLRSDLLAGALGHGLPDCWCRFLRLSLAEGS